MRYDTKRELRLAVEKKFGKLNEADWRDALAECCDAWPPWDDGDAGADIG